MITNNWYRMIRTFYALKDGQATSTISELEQLKDTSGVLFHQNRMKDRVKELFDFERRPSGSDYYGVMFGDGKVAPSADDYTLSGTKFTKFTCQSDSYRSVFENGVLSLVSTYVLLNTDTEAFTINEVCTVVYAAGPGQYDSKYVMIDRTLLDSPVTIPAGEQGVVIYKRGISIPTT